MTLLSAFLDIVHDWRPVFSQPRSHRRAVRQALGGLLCLGRRTLSRIIWTNGGQQRSWSAEYFLHSRSPWDPQQLFAPILHRGLALCPGRYIGVAADDTRLRKTGRCIQQAFYTRDPLSPPFHPNLMLGLRFLQASLLVPLHRRAAIATRALPIRFQHAPCLKRPRRNASAEQWSQFRAARKQHNLSRYFVALAGELRQACDSAGAAAKTLLLVLDGSFCNRTVFTAPLDRTHLLARARKDAKLCFAAPPGSRRFYAADRFTAEQVRQDGSRPWLLTKIFYGGKRRSVRYKDLGPLYWQGGARRQPLRLFVVAPTPYFKRQSGRRYYRQPAYLLTTDLRGPAPTLLQFYFDRWQIEINHREEKDTLGVGQAQLWNPVSVPKQPVLAVAAYSALLLASLLAYGPARGSLYAALPRWRRKANRPSCLDLITLLRKEAVEHPQLLQPLVLKSSFASMASAAAA
jgi:hypothetical protein